MRKKFHNFQELLFKLPNGTLRDWTLIISFRELRKLEFTLIMPTTARLFMTSRQMTSQTDSTSLLTKISKKLGKLTVSKEPRENGNGPSEKIDSYKRLTISKIHQSNVRMITWRSERWCPDWPSRRAISDSKWIIHFTNKYYTLVDVIVIKSIRIP